MSINIAYNEITGNENQVNYKVLGNRCGEADGGGAVLHTHD